ncbi:glycosyltransferase [bacterium]|nr:glycosyltransferase [bacterium]
MKVIWFSEIKWNFLTHRHHHLIRHFPDNWEILFIENFALGKKSHFIPRRDGRVTYVTLPVFKGTEYALINAIQSNIFIRFLLTITLFAWTKVVLLLTGFTGGSRLIFTSNIFFADVLKRLPKKLLIYDCNDYPMGFSGALPIAENYFRKTIEYSDISIAVSEKLLEDIRKYHVTASYVIGNGVDYDLFANPEKKEQPADIVSIPGPIVFYAGVLSDWFDFDLVEKIVNEIPDVAVVMVGPSISPHVRSDVERLSKISRIHFLGTKPHSELPAYIRAAHVCMIPFKRTPLIERFSPNKMYEYLAAGRSVVTMDYTEEIRRLRSEIYVAGNKEEFVGMVRQSLKQKADESELRKIAQENSWMSKSQEIVELINNKLR